jgi:dienelactone hydrolase
VRSFRWGIAFFALYRKKTGTWRATARASRRPFFRINAAWPAYEAALKAAGARFTAYEYPGTQHGFNNDTTPRYDAAAAKLAWSRTVEFLKAQLGGPA